ncbi:MAG: pilus assembly protein TadG-related protein [Acidobacteriaceae bacterium]
MQTCKAPVRPGESGQTTLTFILVLGIFLIALIGFATDFSNLWFHRQKAQAAADAACQAGAMDMLSISQGATTTASAGFVPGTGFNCSGQAGAVPCKYAVLNNYNAGGLTTGTESNEVSVSFPASIPGVTTPPAALTGGTPFMRVDVVDRVRVFFSTLLTGSKTQDVRATAKCGLVLARAPIPIIVLHPTASQSLSTQGNPDIIVTGGPTKSIQVNSISPSAVNIGGSATIDLSRGGPSGTGSSLGVTGGPSTAPGGFVSGTPTSQYWNAPSSPVSDPFAQLPAPPVPSIIPPAGGVAVTYPNLGCPDTSGCTLYRPGYYPATLQVKNQTALFDPGIYYLAGGLTLAANSTVRPSTTTGNGDGIMFYFAGSSSVSVSSNSGKNTSLDPFLTSRVQCPGGAPVTIRDASGNVVNQLNGNILLGICSGTYGDPLGQNRGMLFFQDRAGSSANPNWGGGGQFLLAGNMYFHKCNAAGTGTGCSAPPTGYSDMFSLSGNSGSGTYVLGDIVTDQLQLGGTSGIAMQLNPNAAYNILKVQLLQ